jgi:hypothetical protein
MCLSKVSRDVVFWLVCHCCCVLCAYAAFCVGSRLFCQCCCDCLFKQGVVLVLGSFAMLLSLVDGARC